MQSIDRNLPVAAYFQIAHDLQKRIMNGEWNATRRLPSETQLSKEYAVSRMTVRQALAELDKDGLVSRRQGSGTFIENPPPSQGRVTVTMSSTLSVSQALRDMGYDPEIQLVEATVIPVPSGEIATALQLDANEAVVFFQRNFVVNGQCMAITRSFLPNRMVEGILDHPLEDESVQRTLHHRYGIQDERCQRWIEAVRATDDDAGLLGIETGSPLMVMTSLFTDYKSQPIDYVRSVWPGDTIRVYLEQKFGLSG